MYKTLYLENLPDQFTVPKALYKHLQDRRYAMSPGSDRYEIERDEILFYLNLFRYLSAQTKINPDTVLCMNGDSIVKAKVADECFLQDIGFLTYNLSEPISAKFIKSTKDGLFIKWPAYLRFADNQYMSCHMRVDYTVYSRLKGRYTLLFYLWHRSQVNNAQRAVIVINRTKFRELFSGRRSLVKTEPKTALRGGVQVKEIVAETKYEPLMRDTPSAFRKILSRVLKPNQWVVKGDEIHILPTYEK